MQFEDNFTYQIYQTPIRQLLGAFYGKDLLQLKFFNSQELKLELETLVKRCKNTFSTQKINQSKDLAIQLGEYFFGKDNTLIFQ